MRNLIQRGVPKATAEAAAASLPPGLSPYARGVVQKHFEAYALRRGWVDVRDPAQTHPDVATASHGLLAALQDCRARGPIATVAALSQFAAALTEDEATALGLRRKQVKRLKSASQG